MMEELIRVAGKMYAEIDQLRSQLADAEQRYQDLSDLYEQALRDIADYRFEGVIRRSEPAEARMFDATGEEPPPDVNVVDRG